MHLVLYLWRPSMYIRVYIIHILARVYGSFNVLSLNLYIIFSILRLNETQFTRNPKLVGSKYMWKSSIAPILSEKNCLYFIFLLTQTYSVIVCCGVVYRTSGKHCYKYSSTYGNIRGIPNVLECYLHSPN